MNKKDKFVLTVINIAYVLLLVLVLLPLLWNAQYNVPSADDWSYGSDAYHAIMQEGAGFLDVLKISFQTVGRYYMKWEGRFINSFLASLQPGIWGEQYYVIVPWLMIGSIIVGELLLIVILFGRMSKEMRLYILPILVPTLLFEILYTPSTIESFYWYTGAVNYTFIFGLSMIYMGLFWKLATGRAVGFSKKVLFVLACILALFVGGDNYSVSLGAFTATCAFYLWMMIAAKFKNRYLFKKAFGNTWFPALLEVGSMLACILAPGNQTRLNGNFDGGVLNGPIAAVLQSLTRTATNIYSWMNLRVILMMLLCLPFIWNVLKKVRLDFSWPLLFTLFTYLVYASEMTANLLVDGTTGGGRSAAVLFYSFHMFVLLNEIYWLGWLVGKIGRKENALARLVNKHLLIYCAIVGCVLLVFVGMRDKKELSSYRAYRDYKQGWAEAYKKDWDARFVILHDPSVSEVTFSPVSGYPSTLAYTDLQTEKGYVWVNNACARYYDKQKVVVK